MNILVTIPVNEEHMKKLRAAAPEAEFTIVPQSELTEASVNCKDIIIGNIPHELVKKADSLKWLQLNTAGADGYAAVMPEGVPLTITSGAFGLAISEHMLGMMLMLMKRLHQYRDNQAKAYWHDEGSVKSVEDATVLTIGLGDIGGEFARKCKMLGAYTIGVRRTIHEKPDYIDELYSRESIEELLPRADVIALAVPSGETTFKLINEHTLSLMKEGAIILNVGRGNAVDTDALADAVESGRVLCGLDVTDPEPLPKEHRLWHMENALITPHISGFFHLKQTLDRIVDISAKNLKLFLSGENLMNMVDYNTGYRSYERRVQFDESQSV